MKGLKFILIFLGANLKKSDKTKSDYTIAKFVEPESKDVFEFYVGDEKLLEQVKALKDFSPVTITIDITSYQGNIKVKLADVCQLESKSK
jgi:hypothetical protein